MFDTLHSIVGEKNVVSGDDAARWSMDWTGKYANDPIAVVRPRNTKEVAEVLALANAEGIEVVPLSGFTGITGAGQANGALILSLDRLNTIEEVNPTAMTATVGAGVILSSLHDAADAENLIFPLTFGARGSAMIGGVLSTNAGGSNVLRYGNTRDLCFGVEVVLADGRIMNLMSELHKDNSGLNLKHLFIGAEGTLGVITRAVMKLFPKPTAYATALVSVPSIDDGLHLLQRLKTETGGAVDACEYMPRLHIETYYRMHPELTSVFETIPDHAVLIEIGATSPKEAQPDSSGQTPVAARLEETLGEMFEAGQVLDALIANSDSQRETFWAIREAAAEVNYSRKPFIDNDVALPLDKVQAFHDIARDRLAAFDPGIEDCGVAHLGDGNVHFTVYPTKDDPDHADAILNIVEDVVAELGGSFSAEHGIGKSKLSSMSRRKDPVAIATMKALKQTMDPNNILNPGKVYPA